MNNNIEHNWRNYKYSIKFLREDEWKRVVRFICKKAKINEEFLEEDIQSLIKDLPNIFDKIDQSNKFYFIKIRVSETEKIRFQQKAKMKKMAISSYIRHKCLKT